MKETALNFNQEDSCIFEDSYGTKRWFQNGKQHRLDGPAIEGANGTKIWYFHGEYKTQEVNEFIKFHEITDNYEDWPQYLKLLAKAQF
ncbi:hypothetical protein ACF3NX_06460 [Acetobacter orientalis]|uniref:hypothetical protein n=1 Tax=Acetobacter orientalis TaxID=146474 RepID=UPI00386F9B06